MAKSWNYFTNYVKYDKIDIIALARVYDFRIPSYFCLYIKIISLHI